MILTDRGYVKHGMNRIKFITASVFIDPYSLEAHEWIWIAPPDDERKFHFRSGAQWIYDWFASIPVGVWCRIEI